MKTLHRCKIIVCAIILLSIVPVALAQDDCNWLITPDENLLQHFDIENSALTTCGADINIGVINPSFPARETINGLESSGNFIVHPNQIDDWSSANSNLQTSEIIQAIHSLAPDANILFYRLSGPDDFLIASEWMQNENANIIVNLVTHPVFDQQDLEDIHSFMDSALENNILWLNSAGNYGNSYYEGTFDNSNSPIDGWHSFQSDDNGLLPIIPVDPNTNMRVYLLWDQEQVELDLFALASPDDLGNFIEISTEYLDQDPLSLVLTIPDPLPDKIYLTTVNTSFFQESTTPLNFRIFASNGIIQLPFEISGNSITTPNDNPNTLTIGALPLDNQLLTSSSYLGLSKPEITTIGVNHEGDLSSGIATAVVAAIAARIWSLDTTEPATYIYETLLENRSDTMLVVPSTPSNNITYLMLGATALVTISGGVFLVQQLRRKEHIQTLFEEIDFEMKFTDDMREMLVILRMPFNHRGYPKLADYFASIHVDMIFESRLSASPNLRSPLVDVLGSDSVGINLLQGLLTVGREKSHPALTGFHFIPNNQISFDLYFKHMLPSNNEEPAIVWYLSGLNWSDDKLPKRNIRIDIGTSQNKISKELSIKHEGVTSSTISKPPETTDLPSHDGRIFMSYRSTQRDFARKLTIALRQHGIRVWMDAEGGIPIGADWEQTIQKTIDDPETVGMIAVLSPAYVQSENCMRELRRADRRSPKMFIVPILHEPLLGNQMPMNVQDLQYIDFTKINNEENFEETLALLIQRLNHLTHS